MPSRRDFAKLNERERARAIQYLYCGRVVSTRVPGTGGRTGRLDPAPLLHRSWGPEFDEAIRRFNPGQVRQSGPDGVP